MDKLNLVNKKTFNLEEALKDIEESIKPFPKAAMFELYQNGFNTTFEQLLGCIISVRTRDEITLKVSLNLFKVARTPKRLLN